ncbi:MAG TPA: molybdopterin molybdenumtransferase MoeA [Betaproteobacteria bacterium]|nr:molybdopterin molybdenumtransferase MoeA [Betaproteobacteria bacterium]
MALTPVSEALERVLNLCPVMATETVPLAEDAGRVLAEPVAATRNQPPFRASAMGGYAVRAEDLKPGARLELVGESPAGGQFEGTVGAGDAVRIFTGGAVPEGADRVVIQENVSREGNTVLLNEAPGDALNLRPVGADFKIGDTLAAPRRLSAADIALLAAMNIPDVPVRKKPVVAVIPTGDELVMPGEQPGPTQIITSNNFALKAQLEAQGAEVRLLPIARDNRPALRAAFKLTEGADMVVTLGGASVGDYDLIGPMAEELGISLDFSKIAMRPGKPLIAGHISGVPMFGLPGNPVSSMVCTHVFLRPAIDKMLGLDAKALPRQRFALTEALPENGVRAHYMRGRVENGTCTPASRQDSALITVMANSNALIVRAPFVKAAKAGDMVECILF